MNSVEPNQNKVYDRRDYSVSMGKANWFSLIMMGPIVFLLGVVYVITWGYQNPANEIMALLSNPSHLLIADLMLAGIFIVGGVIHEFIHGITWRLAGKKPWTAIKFGFQLRTLTPYTHCRDPLPLTAYRIGTWMPGLLTGFVPAVIGVLTGNVWIVLVGGLFICAAGGDALILWLLRGVDRTALVEDHPTRAGCYILLELVNNRKESQSKCT